MSRKLLPLLLLCALVLTSCAPVREAERPSLLLGFSQLGSESSWRVGNTKDIEDKAKEYGISLMLDNANQKQENQIAAIRSFIAYRVDAIAFSPIVEEGWDTVLSEAKQAGIPVILVDRDIRTAQEGLVTCQLGADFYEEGKKAGEYLIRKADQINADHLRIVEISGTVDSTPMRQRHAGFMDAISSDSRMTVLESISGDFIKSGGAECMRAILKKYGSAIDVVYFHNDDMTVGALPEIEKSGMIPGKDLIIISIDGGQEAMDILKAGKINCIVECTPMLGSLLMETVLKLKQGEPVELRTHPAEVVFSDFDDLSDLTPRGY